MSEPILLPHPVRIAARASAVGGDEYRGPLGSLFDFHDESDRFGVDTWEKAEGELGRTVCNLLLARAGLSHRDVDLLFAGDLQNQCMASVCGLSGFGIPYFGLYGACSTFVEGILLASLALTATGNIRRVAVITTSHNCAAERQFRLPLEYGGQRPPTAQWTATAGGALLLDRGEGGVGVTALLAGRMVDSGLTDASNMGAAMAPAAADTLLRYFDATREDPAGYDAIVTGDLGSEGSGILSELLAARGLSLGARHIDCGMLLYDRTRQDAHAGASGCGCSAAVTAAHILPMMERGEMRRVLLMATGALMSPSGIQQGCPIVGIAPLARLEVSGI